MEVPRVAIDYLFLGRVLDKSKAQEDLTVVELKLQKTQKQNETKGEGVMPVHGHC